MLTIRVNYGEGRARVKADLKGTVGTLREAVSDAIEARGRYVCLFLSQDDATRRANPLRDVTVVSELKLKRGQWIFARFYGEMDDEGKKELREEREKAEKKRALAYAARAELQPGFPEYGRKYVYKERQIGKMCGQHALNALLQGPYEREEILERTAKSLEASYRVEIGGSEGRSPYRDVDGNYSIEVLKEVLKSTHGLSLISLDHPSQQHTRRDPSRVEGFLLHKQNHWFAIRKVHGVYWVLDSTRKTPESLPTRLIGDVIRSLGHQGYIAFVVCGGRLPQPRPNKIHAKCWFDSERVLYDEKQPGADKNRWLQIDDRRGDRPRSNTTRSSSTVPSEDAVKTMMSMGAGWSRSRCERALRETGGDVNAAVNKLLSG